MKKIKGLAMAVFLILSASRCTDLVATSSLEDRESVRKSIETWIAPEVLIKYAPYDYNRAAETPEPSPSPSGSPSPESLELSERYFWHGRSLWERPLDYYYHVYDVASLCISKKYLDTYGESGKYGNDRDYTEDKKEINQIVDDLIRVLGGDFSILPKKLYNEYYEQKILSPSQMRVSLQTDLDLLRLLSVATLLDLVAIAEDVLPKQHYESLPSYYSLNQRLSDFAQWLKKYDPKKVEDLLAPAALGFADGLFDDLVKTIQEFHRENLGTEIKYQNFINGYAADEAAGKVKYPLLEVLLKLKDLIADLKRLGQVMDREFEKRKVVTDPIKVNNVRAKVREMYDQVYALTVQDMTLVKKELENHFGSQVTDSNAKSEAFCQEPYFVYQQVTSQIEKVDPDYYPKFKANENFLMRKESILKLLEKYPLKDISKISSS